MNHGFCVPEKNAQSFDWQFVNNNGCLHEYLNWLVCPIREKGEAVVKDLCVARVRRVVRHVCAARVNRCDSAVRILPGKPEAVRQIKNLEIANIS